MKTPSNAQQKKTYKSRSIWADQKKLKIIDNEVARKKTNTRGLHTIQEKRYENPKNNKSLDQKVQRNMDSRRLYKCFMRGAVDGAELP